MRLGIALIVFIMASATIAGSLVTLAVSAPSLGLDQMDKFGWVALTGFVVALPVSYVISGIIYNKTRNR